MEELENGVFDAQEFQDWIAEQEELQLINLEW